MSIRPGPSATPWLPRCLRLFLPCLCLTLLWSWAPAGAQPVPLPYSAAVAERFPPPPTITDTPGLAPGRDSFTSNAEIATWLQALQTHTPAAQRPAVSLWAAGRSSLGSPIWALRIGAVGGGIRPTVLVMAGQHGDEPASTEAVLALARQLAGGALPAVWQQLDVVLVPRVNPDGAAIGSRTSITGQDLNRDHLLLQTPEAAALASMAYALQPLLVVDMHEYRGVGHWLPTLGAESSSDLLYQMATTPQLNGDQHRVSQAWFLNPMVQALQAAGLRSDWYHSNFSHDGIQRVRMGDLHPGLARNAYGLRHCISVLLESRGIGLGRLHLQRRVYSQLVAVSSLLNSAAQHAKALAALRDQAAASTVGRACHGDVTVLAAHRPTQRALPMLDALTGADTLIPVPWEDALQWVPVTQRARPCGYWLSADAEEAVQRLQALGLQVQRLPRTLALRTEAWVERPRPDAQAPALGLLRRADVDLQPQDLIAPAGSWWLSLAQPLAGLAIAALEPDSPGSYFANRVLPALDSVVRVLVMPTP